MIKLKELVFIVLLVLANQQCPDGTTGYNCASCPTGCDNCDTTVSSCDTCSTGYYLDSSSVCNACPTNCLECQTPQSCTRCIPGYDTTTNSLGYEECQFKWWKWFLILFGTLLGIFLIAVLIWCIRKKLDEQSNEDKEIELVMQHQQTQQNVQT